MHLAELLAQRTVPASAIFMAITRRCTLGCRHCSTASEATSPELPARWLRRFVDTFAPDEHPEFLLLTGGEPLLRPGLARSLASAARQAGTRSYLLTGAFFARTGGTPASIRAALAAVDHVAVSIDAFHEEAVPRAQAFRVLHEILDAGRDASIQACGTGAGDPYIADLVRHVSGEFGERVPILVTRLRPAGRGRTLLAAPAQGAPGPARRVPAVPCDLASWPVIGFDGTIAACCNQDVIDSGPAAGHLRIGHVSTDSWPRVRDLVTSSPMLRWLRSRGPVQLAGQLGTAPPEAGYCAACRSLAGSGAATRLAEAQAARPAFGLIEQQVAALRAAGPVAFARRHGDPARARLVMAGYPGSPEGEPW